MRVFACAVKRRGSSAGASPARQLKSLQPVAIGAAVEATKPPKPSMQRIASGDPASRQAVTCSERRAGLETRNVGADPPQKRGRPPSLEDWGVDPREATRTSGPTGEYDLSLMYASSGPKS